MYISLERRQSYASFKSSAFSPRRYEAASAYCYYDVRLESFDGFDCVGAGFVHISIAEVKFTIHFLACDGLILGHVCDLLWTTLEDAYGGVCVFIDIRNDGAVK